MFTVIRAAVRPPFRRLFPAHGLPRGALELVRVLAGKARLTRGELSQHTGYSPREVDVYIDYLLKSGVVCATEAAPGLLYLARRGCGER